MNNQSSNQGGRSQDEPRRDAGQSQGSDKGRGTNQSDTEKKRSEDRR